MEVIVINSDALEGKENIIKKLELTANTLRADVLRALNSAGSGHSAGSLGMADIFTSLFFHTAKLNPKDVTWAGRDRIVLSNGHICPILYTAMANRGFFPVEELLTLRKFGGRLHGHPHNLALPGLETSSGPLGQGISQAVGFALAAKMKKQSHTVYCLMGDGEINEGQVWEAFMFAAHKKLDNLVVIIDRNFIQIDGNTEQVMALEPLAEKFRSFGFEVFEIDGHSMQTIVDTLEEAKEKRDMPVCILAKTIPGKGVSYMENDYNWHGKVPNNEELEIALKELTAERKRIENE